MELKVTEDKKVSPFFAFFLVYAIQVGIGILSFERTISDKVGYDSWLSILIAGFFLHIPLWMMFRLLENGGGDLINIHRRIFGKWIGGLLTIGFIIYLLMLSLVVLCNYIEIINVWMFPHVSYWMLAFLIIFLAYTFIVGGFRTVTGISFLSIIYGAPLLFTLWSPLEYAHFSNIQPLIHHSILSIILSSKSVMLNFIGVELLLIFYPFLKEPRQAKRWAFYAIWSSTFLYFTVAVVAFSYFNRLQIHHIIWPTLSLWKIVSLPFLERFEYLGITIWLFVIIPNLCLCIWAASRTAKRLFSLKQRMGTLLMLVIVFIIGSFFDNHLIIDKLNTIQADIGFYLLFVYIPILFFIQLIINKVRDHHAKG